MNKYQKYSSLSSPPVNRWDICLIAAARKCQLPWLLLLRVLVFVSDCIVTGDFLPDGGGWWLKLFRELNSPLLTTCLIDDDFITHLSDHLRIQRKPWQLLLRHGNTIYRRPKTRNLSLRVIYGHTTLLRPIKLYWQGLPSLQNIQGWIRGLNCAPLYRALRLEDLTLKEVAEIDGRSIGVPGFHTRRMDHICLDLLYIVLIIG